MRVHEYAKQFNVSSKEVLQVLEENNISVKSHMSVLGDDVILMLDKNFKNEQGSKIEDVKLSFYYPIICCICQAQGKPLRTIPLMVCLKVLPHGNTRRPS